MTSPSSAEGLRVLLLQQHLHVNYTLPSSSTRTNTATKRQPACTWSLGLKVKIRPSSGASPGKPSSLTTPPSASKMEFRSRMSRRRATLFSPSPTPMARSGAFVSSYLPLDPRTFSRLSKAMATFGEQRAPSAGVLAVPPVPGLPVDMLVGLAIHAATSESFSSNAQVPYDVFRKLQQPFVQDGLTLHKMRHNSASVLPSIPMKIQHWRADSRP